MLALCTSLVAAADARAAQITGISDQNLPVWTGHAPDVFRAIDVPQVRMFVPWDVALHAPPPGGCAPGNAACGKYVEVANWIGDAHARGKQILISFDRSGSLPEPIDYRYAVDQFRAHFPDVTEFTAWNEPNHPIGAGEPQNPHDDPIRAARYWNQLNAACQTPSSTGKTCTVAAGDFSDYHALDTYTRSYKAALSATPSVWAVHAYDAVDNRTTTALRTWIQNSIDGRPVWITEVGAYKCTTRASRTEAEQNDDAANLNWLMGQLPADKLHRVYYYFLATRSSEGLPCGPDDYRIDTGLFGPNSHIRPALQTLFPALQPPAASTSEATDIGETTVTLNGSVDPRRMPTKYRFEYGRTTAYGRSVPIPDGDAGAGSGSVTVSNVVSGLEWGTTYHYRLVAENAFGRTDGADRTFRTRVPRPPFARPAVLNETTNGRQEVYYFRPNGEVWRWAFDGRSWTNRSLGSGAPARRNTSPTVVRGAADDRELYYVGADGHVKQWFFNGRQWFNGDLGSPGAAVAENTSPVAIRAPGADQREVYYTGADGQIKQWFFNGRQWFNGNLSVSRGTDAAPGTSPAVTRDPVTGQEELYYVGADGQVKQWFFNGRQWFNGGLPGQGATAAENTSPVVVRGPGPGQREIYYLGADGQVKQWFANGLGGWFNGNLGVNGAAAAPNGEPFAVQGPGAGQEEVFYTGADGRVMQWFYNGRDTWFNGDLGAPAPPAHPGASPAAVKGTGGQEFLYYLSADGQIQQWFYDGSGTWFNSPLVENAQAAPFAGPFAVKGPGAGQEEVYAFDDDGTLRQWFYTGRQWFDAPIGDPLTAMRAMRGTRPFAVAGPGPGQEEIYYVGVDGQIHQWFFNGTDWFNGDLGTSGVAAASGTSPYVVRGPGAGQREVYYVGVDGQIYQWFFNGTDWFNGDLGSRGALAAPRTSPVVTRDEATGQEELYYVGADGQIKQWFYNGRGAWFNGGLGPTTGAAAAEGTSPVVLRAPGDDQREVYYVGADGFVKQWFQNGRGVWTNGGLGAPGAAVADDTSPVVLRPTGASDRRELYYQGTDGQIKRWSTNGGGAWTNGGLGSLGAAATPGTSPFVLQAPGETQREVYYVGLDGRIKQWFYNGIDTWFNSSL